MISAPLRPLATPLRLRVRRHARRLVVLALYAAGVFAVYSAVNGALHRGGPATASAIAPNTAAIEAVRPARMLAALAVAGRASASAVSVRAPSRRGTGFVAWTDARYSYVLTARAVVGRLVRSGGRSVSVEVAGRTAPGRVVAVDRARELAVVRVPGKIARAMLDRPLGRLAPGDVAVTTPPRVKGRGQPVAIGVDAAGHLLARGRSGLTIGAAVLLLDGRLGGILVGGGETARVVPLTGCGTRAACLRAA